MTCQETDLDHLVILFSRNVHFEGWLTFSKNVWKLAHFILFKCSMIVQVIMEVTGNVLLNQFKLEYHYHRLQFYQIVMFVIINHRNKGIKILKYSYIISIK